MCVWRGGGGWESFKDCVWRKEKNFQFQWITLAELSCQILFMGQNEWKYAFDRVLQWREWNGKTSVLTRSCSILAIFFQTGRELCGNESNKNVVFRPGSPFLSLGKQQQSPRWWWMCCLVRVFPTLTSRWRHWSRVLSRTALSVRPKHYEFESVI